MWIRSIRWVEATPARSVRASYMPAPNLTEDVDTSAMTPKAFAALLPATGPGLYERGSLVAEFVIEEVDEPDELRDWLTVCSPIGAQSVADYVMLKDPIAVIGYANRTAGGIDESASADMRAFDAVEFGFDGRDPRRPRLVARSVRTVSNDRVLLIFWGARWGYPAMPRSRVDEYVPVREFPGRIAAPKEPSDSLARGVPALQATFASEWGGGGPAAFDAAAAPFGADPAVGAAQVAEAFLAALVTKLQAAATEGLSLAHDQWEADLMAGLHDDDDVAAISAPSSLAVLGGIVGLLRAAADDMSDPFDHVERYWYAKTPDSARIDDGLVSTSRSLDRFSERLRTSLALGTSVAASRSLALQRSASEQTARFQTVITVLGSLVLMPTLIVGFFGANVPVPLGQSWWGFGLMSLLLVVSAAVTWRFLNSLLPGRGASSSPDAPP